MGNIDRLMQRAQQELKRSGGAQIRVVAQQAAQLMRAPLQHAHLSVTVSTPVNGLHTVTFRLTAHGGRRVTTQFAVKPLGKTIDLNGETLTIEQFAERAAAALAEAAERPRRSLRRRHNQTDTPPGNATTPETDVSPPNLPEPGLPE